MCSCWQEPRGRETLSHLRYRESIWQVSASIRKARLSMEWGELVSEEAQDSKADHSIVNMAEGPSLPLHDFLDYPSKLIIPLLQPPSSRWTPDPGESAYWFWQADWRFRFESFIRLTSNRSTMWCMVACGCRQREHEQGRARRSTTAQEL